MTLPDANVFIYAVDARARQHSMAKLWLESALSGTERVGLAWLALLAFVRISTRSSIMATPMPVSLACDYLDQVLENPITEILQPGREHARIVRQLLVQAGTAGNLVSDAHLAALAIEHGAELVTFDRDFGRFAGLRWRLLKSP